MSSESNTEGKVNIRMEPCSHCRSTRVAFRKKRGTVGTATKTTFYHETVECKNCNISVSARSPGNAVKLWNRAWYFLKAEGRTPSKTANPGDVNEQ